MPKDQSRQVKLKSRLLGRAKSPTGYQEVPWLNLTGLWLLKAGFEIGDTLEITINKDTIMVKRKQMP